jgi:hypothetical protein
MLFAKVKQIEGMPILAKPTKSSINTSRSDFILFRTENVSENTLKIESNKWREVKTYSGSPISLWEGDYESYQGLHSRCS